MSRPGSVIETVAVVGVGLIGGSFALALKKAGFTGRILGVSSPKTIEKALAAGAIDDAAPLEQALAAADLVYLAQPVLGILEQLPEVARLARPEALVTDAGSTKAAIVALAQEVFDPPQRFLGGHPMAGKEGRGVENSDPSLFQNAVYALTPGDSTLPSTPIVTEFVNWVGEIGARPEVFNAQRHDEIAAWTSHLPQLLASVLASAISAEIPSERELSLAGGGLRDMTRLAESPFAVWKGVFSTNRAAILHSLDRYMDVLSGLRAKFDNETLEKRFEEGERFRKQLRET